MAEGSIDKGSDKTGCIEGPTALILYLAIAGFLHERVGVVYALLMPIPPLLLLYLVPADAGKASLIAIGKILLLLVVVLLAWLMGSGPEATGESGHIKAILLGLLMLFIFFVLPSITLRKR